MATSRRATATWHGDLMSGHGTVSGDSSRAFDDLGLSWKARAERADGQSSPEEFLAAAHAGCFSMALAHALAQAGHTPTSLETRCTVTFDPTIPRVTESVLEVRGEVPGMDEASFMRIAEQAKEGCPISQALRGNLSIQLRGHLETHTGMEGRV